MWNLNLIILWIIIFTRVLYFYFQIQVSFEEEIGFEIYRVFAKDADTALNAMITYKIKSQNYNNDLFTINARTGSITVAKRLTSSNLVKLFNNNNMIII